MLVCPTSASVVEIITSDNYKSMRVGLVIADKLVKTIIDDFMFILFFKLLMYFIQKKKESIEALSCSEGRLLKFTCFNKLVIALIFTLLSLKIL